MYSYNLHWSSDESSIKELEVLKWPSFYTLIHIATECICAITLMGSSYYVIPWLLVYNKCTISVVKYIHHYIIITVAHTALWILLQLHTQSHPVCAWIGITLIGEASSKQTELCTKQEASYGCYVQEVAKPVWKLQCDTDQENNGMVD